MAKLVWVQLETCHANTDGVAWYAYFVGEPTDEELDSCFNNNNLVEKAPLGRLDEGDPKVEVPNPISKATALRRYYVGGAC